MFAHVYSPVYECTEFIYLNMTTKHHSHFPAATLFVLISVLLFSCTKPDNMSQGPEGGFDINKLAPGLSTYPETLNADEPCTLYYKAGGSFPFSGYTGELYAHIGLVNFEWEYVQAEWNVNIAKCRWQKTEAHDVWKLNIEPSVREWFGAPADESVTKIGVVVRNSNGSQQTKPDFYLRVEDEGKAFVPADVEYASIPEDAEIGINIVGTETVTLAFYDKDTHGEHHPHSFLVGDFNGWKLSNEWQMKYDDSEGCWWYTITGLDADKEYRFQYHVIDSEGDAIRISDPYSEIVYSADDKWIPSSTYPDIPSYPDGTSGLVSAFRIKDDGYKWMNDSFSVDDKDDLVIYELHLRDFSATHDLSGAEEHLDYLVDLGVNAIELMPVQEFDGNDSWGYNPCSYFALDKAYGTREHYKSFIDKCHGMGIAVILDVVYNHATGAHPMAKLYWDSANNATAANNPWFNVAAPHPYSVYHDWNHENMQVRNHIKRNLRYLMEEYHFDGFRFDLTKGFTQRYSTETTAANYDASRIAIIKDYAGAVFDFDSDAVVILEHFCDNREEKELAQSGIKLWRNMNNAYCQTAMGWLKEGDGFDGMWTESSFMPFGSLVGFQESHDEERTAYKALKWGNGITADLAARMKRAELNAAFSLLIPGPKMIWQFGELGYDISIDVNGRTGAKPLHWDYLEVAERKALYDTYSAVLKFRREYPRFFDSDASFVLNAGSGAEVRSICGWVGSRQFAVLGNFGTTDRESCTLMLPSSGSWKDYLSGKVWNIDASTVIDIPLKAGEFVLLIDNN